MLISKYINKFGTLSFNSVLYQSANAFVSKKQKKEEIKSCHRWMRIDFSMFWLFSSLFFFQSPLEISVGFYIYFTFYFGKRIFSCACSEKIISKHQTWFSLTCFTVNVSYSCRLVSSKDNSIENVDRSISLVEDSERWWKIWSVLEIRIDGIGYFRRARGWLESLKVRTTIKPTDLSSYFSSPSSSSSSYHLFLFVLLFFFVFIHLLYFLFVFFLFFFILSIART